MGPGENDVPRHHIEDAVLNEIERLRQAEKQLAGLYENLRTSEEPAARAVFVRLLADVQGRAEAVDNMLESLAQRTLVAA